MLGRQASTEGLFRRLLWLFTRVYKALHCTLLAAISARANWANGGDSMVRFVEQQTYQRTAWGWEYSRSNVHQIVGDCVGKTKLAFAKRCKPAKAEQWRRDLPRLANLEHTLLVRPVLQTSSITEAVL
jgi:hypothetical protein